jgi:hypothetical protein
VKIEMTPQEVYETLLNYMFGRIHQCDWHGVSDAANDIRELLQKYKGQIEEPNGN